MAFNTPVFWVKRLKDFRVSASNRAPISPNVFSAKESAAFAVTLSSPRMNLYFECFFSSQRIVDFEETATAETALTFAKIFLMFFPCIVFHSKSLLRCTLLHNYARTMTICFIIKTLCVTVCFIIVDKKKIYACCVHRTTQNLTKRTLLKCC
jgi:hypothetical protein